MLEDLFVRVFGQEHGSVVLGILIYMPIGFFGFKLAWSIVWRVVELESNYRWGYTKACADFLNDAAEFEKVAKRLAGRDQ